MGSSEIERLGRGTDPQTVATVLQMEALMYGRPRIHQGTFYFATEDAARESARAARWPTDRVVPYGLGWAVQAGPSGNYFGPDGNVVPRPWKGAEGDGGG